MDGYIYDMDINKNNNYKKGKRFASCLFSPVFVSVITASRWSLQVHCSYIRLSTKHNQQRNEFSNNIYA